MDYILLDKITIDRPIIFLCGPNYEKKNPSDRRVILQKYISNEFNNKYLPLVVDDFLIKNNINDSNISIQLMEEICAAVAVRTYIFLDTMSSATELGIFANSSFSNKITAFIPKKKDIYNRGNVGYFVKDIVLKNHPDQVMTLEYRPRIDRKVIATDFVTEHYSFVDDKLPENIICNLNNDLISKNSNRHTLRVENSSNDTDEAFKIRFSTTKNCLSIHTSIRLLFYVAASIMHCLYKDILVKRDSDFSKFDIDEIERKVKYAYARFVSSKVIFSFEAIKKIELATVLNQNSKELIYHIAKFIHVYYLYSSFDKVHLMKNPLNCILQEDLNHTQLNQIIQLSAKEAELIDKINLCKTEYFKEISITTGKKVRKIVTYLDDNNGNKARKLHEKIVKQLLQKYNSNPASYAYQKHKNIKLCAEVHLSNKSFAKYDIKSFFNSISIDLAEKIFIKTFNIPDTQREQVHTLLDSCFWNDELPLGLITSPLISDMYLHAFDEVIANNLNAEGMVYTRYADDILISSPEFFSENHYYYLDSLITEELKKYNLS